MKTKKMIVIYWGVKEGNEAVGRLEITFNKPFKCKDDFADIEKQIKEENGFDDCLITNVILLPIK